MPEATFPGMGSRIHIALVDGTDADLVYARDRLARLESLWSRFRPDSELSRLNGRGQLAVSAETRDLVQLAVSAWQLTDGLFDPTVHDAVVGAGYDRTFTEVRSRGPAHTAEAAVPGCAGIRVDGLDVALPNGTRLDFGGIGKGRAADLVATELLARGVAGACVNVGGDVRVAGQAPEEAGTWAVAVEDPFAEGGRKALVGLDDGAVASSTTLKRRWATASGEAHHLIDPRTGRPGASDVAAATVIASEAVWAEIFAKCVVIAGTRAGLGLVGRHRLASLVTVCDGTTVRTNSFERYEPWTAICGGTWPAPVG